jgi:hypothetical protein
MKKIAILFPGDMGGALAKILVEDGFLVTSFLEGRSQRTRNSAAAAGVLGLPSWNQLAAESELVISLVPPSAVVSVAESYAAAAKAVGSKAVFVDANAKSPATATQVAGIIRQANAPFVNACVIGGANSLREKGAIFVSGPDSSALVESLKGSVAVTDLGSDIESSRNDSVEPILRREIVDAKWWPPTRAAERRRKPNFRRPACPVVALFDAVRPSSPSEQIEKLQRVRPSSRASTRQSPFAVAKAETGGRRPPSWLKLSGTMNRLW